MLKGMRFALGIIGMCALTASLQAQCPGYTPGNNTNLACEIATASRSTAQDATTLSSISATLATQLSQLPIATAVSGSGITIGASGLPTVSTEGLGTILTQRGGTIGKHKLMLSFNFQRFVFQSVDGISLKGLPVVVNYDPTKNNVFLQDASDISFRVDQFTAMATFGLTSRIDVSFIVPFSKVDLSTSTSANLYSVQYTGTTPTAWTSQDLGVVSLPGSASGIGDVRVNIKANVLGGEGKTAMALGGEVRFPTGDERNYLGTGAYGFKPYLVLSHRGRLTPNVSIGYQWNGSSILNFSENLPAAFLYSGGADLLVTKKASFTLTGEFLGQYVIDAPRLTVATTNIPIVGGRQTVSYFKGSYAMNNAGAGFKLNPFKGLILSANALFKLDDAGLRSKIVPLFGVAYRF
jgi:hypothetical protein